MRHNAGDFTMIHIKYFRNEQLLAARVEKNQGRLNFIEWAVALLRARAPASIDQDALLAAWNAVPKAERYTENVACIFHLEGIGAKRCLGRMDGNEWQECNVTGKNHSIPAWEFYVTSTERTLGKSYRWSLGLFSFPSADQEGRFPANKRIHERGSCLGERLHEFFLVLWIGIHF